MGTVDDVLENMTDVIKKKWFTRLVDSTDKSVSPSTVFLIVVTVIGCILLLIPAIILLIEVWYNHTITTDLNGMAAYITAVVALFATGGLTKAWTSWATKKYENTPHKSYRDNSSDEGINIDEDINTF